MAEAVYRSLLDRKVTIRGRWFRIALIYGTPPGSHIGYWRTRWCGLNGINLRVGRRYVGPCLTLMLHTMASSTGNA
jgi:hypothetical protein